MSAVHGVAIAIGLVASVSGQGLAGSAACERMFQEVRTVQNTSAIDRDKRALVTNLIKMGLERCAADDQVHADLFFSQALQIMGK